MVSPTRRRLIQATEAILLHLADFYLDIDMNTPCLHWFEEEVGVFRVAVGADGAPFGKDNTATGN